MGPPFGWWLCMVFEDTRSLGVPANPLLISDRPSLFKALANGRLIAEGTLAELRQRSGRGGSLEDVFLTLVAHSAAA